MAFFNCSLKDLLINLASVIVKHLDLFGNLMELIRISCAALFLKLLINVWTSDVTGVRKILLGNGLLNNCLIICCVNSMSKDRQRGETSTELSGLYLDPIQTLFEPYSNLIRTLSETYSNTKS